MFKNEKIDIRIRALKFNLDQLNSAYKETLRDVVLDTGMEYGEKYPYNSETLKIIKQQDELRKSREDILFFTIFNFTQVYYSIKEYLKKEYPGKKNAIEDFYSARHLGFRARKDISNDLKHNPSNDLKYEFAQVDKEETIEGRKKLIKLTYKHTWFYYGIDSVEYCNNLYEELTKFIHKDFLDKHSN